MQPLTPIQSQAIARLLAGQSVTAVARELQIDRSTIYDWRNNRPQFRQALDEGRARLDELTADALADLAATAVETLRLLLTSVITPPSVRLRAAETVLRVVHQQRQTRQAGSSSTVPETRPDHSPEPAPGGGNPPSAGIPQNPTPSAGGPRLANTGRNQPCSCGSTAECERCCPGIPQNPTQSGGGPSNGPAVEAPLDDLAA